MYEHERQERSNPILRGLLAKPLVEPNPVLRGLLERKRVNEESLEGSPAWIAKRRKESQVHLFFHSRKIPLLIWNLKTAGKAKIG